MLLKLDFAAFPQHCAKLLSYPLCLRFCKFSFLILSFSLRLLGASFCLSLNGMIWLLLLTCCLGIVWSTWWTRSHKRMLVLKAALSLLTCFLYFNVQERKTELQQAIINMEQGGSVDGILQVETSRNCIRLPYSFLDLYPCISPLGSCG